MTNKKLLEDLLTEYDELDMQPLILIPDPLDRAKKWKRELEYAINHLEAEIAREIFEEIDKRLDHITVVVNPNDCFITTFRKTMEKVTAEVDDLKKKYTEGQK